MKQLRAALASSMAAPKMARVPTCFGRPGGVSGQPSRNLGKVRSRPRWLPPYQMGRSPAWGRGATE
jgi:hypothetical protein